MQWQCPSRGVSSLMNTHPHSGNTRQSEHFSICGDDNIRQTLTLCLSVPCCANLIPWRHFDLFCARSVMFYLQGRINFWFVHNSCPTEDMRKITNRFQFGRIQQKCAENSLKVVKFSNTPFFCKDDQVQQTGQNRLLIYAFPHDLCTLICSWFSWYSIDINYKYFRDFVHFICYF